MLAKSPWRESRNQYVTSIAFGIEEDGRAELSVVAVVEVVSLQEAVDIDSQLREQSVDALAEHRVLEIEDAAPYQPHRPTLVELVALGVTAEIVVVLQNEDAGVAAEALAVEVGGGEAADTAADDHEIVFLSEVLAGIEVLALTRQLVRYLERAVVRAAHAGERGRVVASSWLAVR